jgi:hypothetical protein
VSPPRASTVYAPDFIEFSLASGHCFAPLHVIELGFLQASLPVPFGTLVWLELSWVLWLT